MMRINTDYEHFPLPGRNSKLFLFHLKFCSVSALHIPCALSSTPVEESQPPSLTFSVHLCVASFSQSDPPGRGCDDSEHVQSRRGNVAHGEFHKPAVTDPQTGPQGVQASS